MLTQPVRRLAASERRRHLIDTAVEMARRDGVSALTLARVAEAGGVSKPIAYQHFETLGGLLAAVYEEVGADYESAVVGALEAGASQPFRMLCEAYVDCSLSRGALLEEVGAALAAAGHEGRAVRIAMVDRYAQLVARALPEAADPTALTTALLGAADRLCEAVVAGRIDRGAAVATLTSLV